VILFVDSDHQMSNFGAISVSSDFCGQYPRPVWLRIRSYLPQESTKLQIYFHHLLIMDYLNLVGDNSTIFDTNRRLGHKLHSWT